MNEGRNVSNYLPINMNVKKIVLIQYKQFSFIISQENRRYTSRSTTEQMLIQIFPIFVMVIKLKLVSIKHSSKI